MLILILLAIAYNCMVCTLPCLMPVIAWLSGMQPNCNYQHAATLLNIVIFIGEMDFNTWVKFYISAGYILLENLHHQGLHILPPLWAPWLFSRY